jgi:hypothetical protein
VGLFVFLHSESDQRTEDNLPDDIETELDVTPQDDTPGGSGKGKDDEPGERGTSSEKSDRAPRGNRWSKVRDAMGDTLRNGIKGDDTDHQPPEDDEDLDDDDDEDPENGDDSRRARGTAEDDDDLDDDEREREEPEGGEGRRAAAETDPDDDDDDPRYEVVDAESGDRFKVDLPKGAVIRFPGDGRVVEAKSFDEVIKLAQKGAAFDRVSSTQGQETAKLRKAVAEYEESQESDTDLLLKLVFGEISDDDLEALQKELGPYRDPKAREGLRALADREERTKSAKADGERAAADANAKFWETARGNITADLSRFEYLDEEDAPDIESRFYEVYTSELARLTPEYERQAAQQGHSKEDAHAAADRDARKLLTEKTLRKVMRDLDAKYQKRAGKGRDGRAETRGRREVERHNTRVDAKREQRRDPARRSLRSGGAAPRDREPDRRGKEPVGFDAKIRRGLARLRSAGRESSEE